MSRHMGLEELGDLLPSCTSGSPCGIWLWLSGSWSSLSFSFPFPVPRGDRGDQFVNALERFGVLARKAFSFSKYAFEYRSVEFPGRQEVI